MINHDSPLLDGCWKAKTRLLASRLSLTIYSEAFGKRGVCIDVWSGDTKIGFRKSWKSAYALVCGQIPLDAANKSAECAR